MFCTGVSVGKRQKDFNADMDAYLSKRRGGDTSSSSSSFSFTSITEIFSKKESANNVPSVNDLEPTVVESQPRRSWISRLFGSSSKNQQPFDEEDEDLVHQVEEVEHEIEDIDHQIEELEGRRQGFFAWLASLVRSKPNEVEEDEDLDPDLVAQTLQESQEELFEETKDVLKRLHVWISRLPPEQIEAFKRSPDFNAYKDLLDKYGLTKK